LIAFPVPYSLLFLVPPKLAEAYFGEDKTDRFLRQYILNKGWVDNTEAANYVPSYGEVRTSIQLLGSN
jgi:hypothetical protein